MEIITLKKFTESDFETLKSWIHNEEDLVQFSGPIFTYPLTDSQLKSYCKMQDKQPFKVVLSSTNETIGHCELNFENEFPRLSRILIGNPNLRGQKIGEKLVKKMADMLFIDKSVKKIDLNVYEWNTAAIHCYKKVGFYINENQKSEKIVNKKVWVTLNMILDRSIWEN